MGFSGNLPETTGRGEVVIKNLARVTASDVTFGITLLRTLTRVKS